jgi:hypothetical protein
MDAHIQNILHRAVKIIGGFIHKKPTREVSGPILCGVEEQMHKGT